MAGAERLELPTIGFGDRCSTNWNYAPAKWIDIILTKQVKTRVKDDQVAFYMQLLLKICFYELYFQDKSPKKPYH